MISDVPRPDARSLIAGTMTDGTELYRRSQNQAAAEQSGHVQRIPMTSAGIAQLRLLKDVLNRSMSDKGIPAGPRAEILAASPEISLQGQMTRLEISVARPSIQEQIARRQSDLLDQSENHPDVDADD